LENPTSQQVIAFFKGRCVICLAPACVTHEIEPRSRGNSALRFENRVALCSACHEWAHAMGISKKLIYMMKLMRENRIKMMYGNEIPLIETFA